MVPLKRINSNEQNEKFTLKEMEKILYRVFCFFCLLEGIEVSYEIRKKALIKIWSWYEDRASVLEATVLTF